METTDNVSVDKVQTFLLKQWNN